MYTYLYRQSDITVQNQLQSKLITFKGLFRHGTAKLQQFSFYDVVKYITFHISVSHNTELSEYKQAICFAQLLFIYTFKRTLWLFLGVYRAISEKA